MVQLIKREIYVRQISAIQMKKYARKGCQLFTFQVQYLSKNKQYPSLEEYLVLEQYKDDFQRK